jgi:hypothetical protein
MLRSSGMVWVLGLVVLCTSACRKEAEPPPTPEAVTEEEARALGNAFEAALAGCDPAAIDALFDRDHTMNVARAEMKLTQGERRKLREGAHRALPIGRNACADVESGSEYTLLHVRQREGEVSLLYRTLGENGVNYIEIYVGKGEGGSARFYDLYNYAYGERTTESLRELLGAFESRGVRRRAGEVSQNLQDARRFLTAGQWEDALAAIDRLPADARRPRPIRLMRVMAAGGLSDEVYEKAIAEYEKDFPGDPSLDLVSVDGYLIRKQYDEAIAAMDRVDARVGGDPYVHVLKASLFREMRDLEAAWTEAQAAVNEAPDFEEAYWTALTIALERKAHDDATALMTTLRDRFAVEFDPELMAAEALWAEFLESPQWAAWSSDEPPAGDAEATE